MTGWLIIYLTPTCCCSLFHHLAGRLTIASRDIPCHGVGSFNIYIILNLASSSLNLIKWGRGTVKFKLCGFGKSLIILIIYCDSTEREVCYIHPTKWLSSLAMEFLVGRISPDFNCSHTQPLLCIMPNLFFFISVYVIDITWTCTNTVNHTIQYQPYFGIGAEIHAWNFIT